MCSEQKNFSKLSSGISDDLSTYDSIFEKLLNACEKILLRNLCDGLKYRV